MSTRPKASARQLDRALTDQMKLNGLILNRIWRIGEALASTTDDPQAIRNLRQLFIWMSLGVSVQEQDMLDTELRPLANKIIESFR